MTAILAYSFGLEKIDLIEDAIQDSMIKALRVWPFHGIPDKPEAWLIKVARNSLIDKLRREQKSDSFDDLAVVSNETIDVRFNDELAEDTLRMMFACCDPRISPDSRVALTLREIGGFSVIEIAAAFLAKPEAIAKLLTRAKGRLRGTRLGIPPPSAIPERLEAVLRAVYLMFSEGYSTSHGELPIRNDLCFEAIRLAEILANHPVTGVPKTHALLALFFLQTARLPSRFDENGDVLRLDEQDRSRWDQRLLAAGLRQLAKSASGNDLSPYHVEAEIASIHAVSGSFDGTDWVRLVECYDRLLDFRHSPIVALNRAIAIWKVHGPRSAVDQLEPLREPLSDYAHFHITRGEFLLELNRSEEAETDFRRALELCRSTAMFRFLRQRLSEKTN